LSRRGQCIHSHANGFARNADTLFGGTTQLTGGFQCAGGDVIFMANPTYFQHPTISAVARVLHDNFKVEGGVALLRRAARIRIAIAGTEHDEARVALAIEREGWVATDDIVQKIVNGVRVTADHSVPR
jgi:hypothetical protein